MARFKISIEYDGSGFVGWQRQDNGLAVQQVLEQAITAFCHEKVTVFGAGRTDSGVHALAQVAHFDLTAEFSPYNVCEAMNYYLKPHAVAVLNAAIVEDDFHARFSAVGRSYIYRIIERRAPLTLDRGRCWRQKGEIDAQAMHEAAQRLVGKHDFTTFRATHCQAKSPLKTLRRLDVERRGAEIHIYAEARSFLHHQVRNMVGTLVMVGHGKWTGEDVSAALAARTRASGGETAPACGLYLSSVSY